MNNDFLKHANDKRNELLLKTEELYVLNKSKWVDDFSSHFYNVCLKMQKLQSESKASADFTYLEYLMLYTNFIKRRYTSELFLFGNNSYLDKNQCFADVYDISFLLIYFDKLWDELIVLRKRYPEQVTAQDVVAFMLEALPDFYAYLACIARVSMHNFTDKNLLLNGSKNPLSFIKIIDRFIINVGDYLAKTETVYEEQKSKNAIKLADWFGKKLYGKYIFGDYTNLDFSGRAFEHTDFRFARFQDSKLVNVNLEGSSLIEADFRNTDMHSCRLDNCSIHGTDFSYAMLKNSSFINARAKAGLSDDKVWQSPGFLPVSFYCADLTNASFKRADLKGADFRRANLKKADLTKAVLADVNFSQAVLKDASFRSTILSNANFTGAVIGNADFAGAVIGNSNFAGAVIGNANFIGADISNTII
jgi:uncharacterized protein YjbI with pentapeptide repeats